MSLLTEWVSAVEGGGVGEPSELKEEGGTEEAGEKKKEEESSPV
jgi:hypothetical protein